MHLPYDSTVPPLSIFAHGTLMFIADLFVIAPNWKPPEYSSISEWIKKKCSIFVQWTTTQNEQVIHTIIRMNAKHRLNRSNHIHGYTMHGSTYMKV